MSSAVLMDLLATVVIGVVFAVEVAGATGGGGGGSGVFGVQPQATSTQLAANQPRPSLMTDAPGFNKFPLPNVRTR